ncbi:MAG TPA: heme-binding protein, partial [Devosia sp.]|nr:heme-binding protein [Devosia sp.]
IAIVDDAGNLVAFERMDGGKITSIGIAIDKAFTAAAARRATHEAQVAAQPGSAAFGINTTNAGRFVIVGGGLPVPAGKEVIGGVGVSSGTPDQDREVAQAGIDALAASSSNK